MTKEQYDLLDKLARRNNKEHVRWYLRKCFNFTHEEYYCLICYKQISYLPITEISKTTDELFNTHGIMHLKNSGLLAFL